MRLIGQVGDVDCSIGLASDFPDEVLITVISSTGTWYQYAFQGGRSMPAPTGYKAGGDYTQALGGKTWQEFKAEGDSCSVDPATGLISLG